MSSPQRAKEKEGSAPPSRPTGSVPVAMVVARHGAESVTRPGRGYSLGELKGAGVALGQAVRLKVSIDYRRRSVLDGNVSALKGWGSHQGAAKKPKSLSGKVEAELRKVEKEVEKEAEVVEKEVVEAGRKVEKEAKKVKKEVKKVEGGAVKKVKKEKKARAKAKPRAKKK